MTPLASQLPTQLPTGQRGRLLAIAVTLAGLLVLWLAVVSPAIGWYAERATRLTEQRRLSVRMADLAATLPALRRAASADAGAAPRVAVLQGSTDAIAGATLQGLVQDMASRAGASLNSLETLPAATRGPYRRIALRISVSAGWPVLVRLLAAVEQARPQMLIDDLRLRGPLLRLIVPAANAAEPVDATLTILAFRSGAEPKPDAAAPPL